MDSKAVLKSMLMNLANDKRDEAQVDLHSYLQSKMKTIAIGDQQVTADAVIPEPTATDEE